MTTFKLGLSADKRTVYVGKDTVTFPGGGDTVALPSFDHDESDDPIHAHAGNHTLFHHVRDTLYKRHAADGSAGATHPFGIYNMQEIAITRYGAAILAESLSADAVTVADPGTVPLVVKYQPQDVAAANADFTFVSADPAVATVAATGVVTGVSNGTTTITITEKNGNKSVDVTVVIT